MLNPPQTYEILPAVKSLIDTAGVIPAMGGYGSVVATEGDVINVGWPEPAPDGFRWRIVLMEKINGLADPREYPDLTRGYPFRARIDLNPPSSSGFNKKHFLEGAHMKVRQALHMKQIGLTKAEPMYHIIRREVPTPMYRDTDQGWYYMSAEYLTILGPISGS